MSKLAALRWQVRIFWVFSYLFFIKHYNLLVFQQQKPTVTSSGVHHICWMCHFLLCLIESHVLFVMAPKHTRCWQEVVIKCLTQKWNEKWSRTMKGKRIRWWLFLTKFHPAIPSEQEQICDISCWNMCFIEGNELEKYKKGQHQVWRTL